MTKRATPFRAIYTGGRLAVNIPALGYGQTGTVYPKREPSIGRDGWVTVFFFVPDSDEMGPQIHRVGTHQIYVP